MQNFSGLSGLGTIDEDGYASIVPNFSSSDVGKTLQFQFIEKDANNNITWSSKSAAYKVAKKEITAEVTFAETADKAIRYTGQQIELAREAITNAVSELAYSGEVTGTSVDTNAYKSANWIVTGKDTVNAAPKASDDLKVNATGTFEDAHYKVTATGKFWIWRKSVASVDEAVKVELPKYEYEFTGTDITVPATQITVTDKVTNKVVAGAASDFTISTGWVGSKANKVTIDMTKGSLVNLAKNDQDFESGEMATPAQEVKVVARDLSNTANTQISINTITKDELKQDKLSLDTVKRNLVIKDADGSVLMKNGKSNGEFGSKISVKFKDTTESELKVESGKSYTVVISGDNTNIIKEREVSLNVIAYDLNDAVFIGGELSDKANVDGGLNTGYTGEKITYGITSENMTAQLGDLTINDGKTTLVKGVSYEATVRFGENTNAGEAEIIIDGKNDYAGTSKVIKFTISPRTTKENDNWLVVPEKVLYNENNREASDYTVETSVVAKFKAPNVNNVADRKTEKEYTVTVPAENYSVKPLTFKNGVDGNKVGNYLVSMVECTKATTNNFSWSTAFTKDSELVNKAITEADVILEKTEYTYTGKEITPDYKVVVDGVTLEKGKDYTEQITQGVNVGEATLVITGKGDYDDESVSKKFTIVAANISDLIVTASTQKVPTYDGTQHLDKNELSIMLGDKNVSEEVQTLFPTSKTANINAGNATVTLKPAKDNKNFVGEKKFTFTIAPATLTGGTLTAYDKNGTKVPDISALVAYDGAAHTFYSTEYKNSVNGSMKLTADDYDIIYRDNIVGKAEADGKQYGHILVVAKGNYANASKYTCANGDVVENVVIDQKFQIKPIDITTGHTEIAVENGAYAEGKNVDPVVTVTYKGKKLVKDVDYKLDYTGFTQDRTEVTNGKTLQVRIVAIGGYTGKSLARAWGIDKFDLEDAETMVSGTDAEPIVKLINNGVVIDPSEYDLVAKDGKVTVTAKTGSKHYTGTKTFDIKEALEKPETPMIVDVQVSGNKAKVILSGESEGAVGYDYVISKNRNCIVDKDYAKVNKNKLITDTTFQYIEPQGMYYAYCHAWTRDENGKKVFSDWPNAYAFSVSTITPAQPVITKVTVKGSTVTVTYTQAANAEGYDVVLGSKVSTVFDEKRPVEYGTLVKKNISGNTVTAVFKNVPKGTYYAGLHAFNRTSEDGKKVFSPWSNIKTVKVK